MFNYKVPSSCIADKSSNEVRALPMSNPMKEMIKDSWKDYPFRTVIGIAKDGRPILSPFKDGGKLYSDCEVDVCNGITVDGKYMYATTIFHPYVMGCFGPGGDSPKLYQECSANPRLCNVKYEGIKSKANQTSKSEVASGSNSLNINKNSILVLISCAVVFLADIMSSQ